MDNKIKGSVFYKYRSDNKYTEQIFTNNKIWLSDINSLNDPFEGTYKKLTKEYIDAFAYKSMSFQITGFLHSYYSALSNKSDYFMNIPIATVSKMIDNLKSAPIFIWHSFIRDFISNNNGTKITDPTCLFSSLENQISNVGIFSVSEKSASRRRGI